MSTSEERWEKLVGEFRQLCLFRRQKKWIEAEMILKSDLPRMISNWSESIEADPDLKRSRLEAMFQAEKKRVDDAWVVQELLAAQWNEQFVPAICTQVVQELRSVLADETASHDARRRAPVRSLANARAGKARVAFDDIPGIIDLVLAEDRISAGAPAYANVVCPN